MSLRERLNAELTAAMRSQDPVRRDTIRMAIAAAYAIEKRQHRALTDDEVLGVLAHEVKTRRESVEAFQAGGREDLVANELAQIAVLQSIMPAPLDEGALDALIREALEATGAASARDMGRVMGWLAPRTRGRADGRHVSELVARELARADLAAHDAAEGRAR